MAAERSKRPRTTAGRQLRSLILEDTGEEWREVAKDASHFLVRAPASLGLGEVASDAFATLTRRKFARADPRSVSQYAVEAITRVEGGQPGGRLVRTADAAIREALGERWSTRGVGSMALAKAQLAILRDLVSVSSMTTDAVDELIAFAEELCFQRSRSRHVDVIYRSRVRRWFRRLLWRAGSFSQSDRTVEDPAGTLVGRRLFARMTGDTAALARLPHEQREQDGQAVVDALFEIAIQRRFAAGCCLRDIAVFVLEMSRRAPRELRASFLEAEATIRQQLGEPLSVDDIDPTAVLEVRLAAARSAIIDLGLFDHELNQLLKDAEQLAFERGFRPTPA